MSITNTTNIYSIVSNNYFINYGVTALIGITTAYVAGLGDRIGSCFKENTVRKDVLARIATRLEGVESGSMEGVYLRDLKERVSATKKTQDPTAMLESFVESANAYQRLVTRVESAASQAISLQAAESLYREAREELRALESSPITETERSIYIGCIKRVFRELDNKLSKGRPLHLFCGCHIQPENDDKPQLRKMVSYPSELAPEASLEGRAAVLQSWSLGGGHDVAQQGISQRIAETGMHAYHVEADNETILPLDTVRGLTGNRVSDGEVIEFLLRNNCWKTLQVINWAFSGKPSPAKFQKLQDQFIRSLLVRGAPELQMTFYSRNAGAAANGADAIGIADINFFTDLLTEYFDMETRADAPRHFANGAMIGDNALLANAMAVVGAEKTHVTGFPVRKAFLQTYDTDALRDVRNIASDARVVILASGGAGIEDNYPQIILDRYRSDPTLDKIHLVVLCARNTARKKRLEKQFANLHLPHLTVEIRGWTEEEELAKLNAMAADPKCRGALVSSKGGGGTISEGLASGTPMLLGMRKEINWEKVNIDFVCQHGCGQQFQGAGDLMEKLQAVFRMEYHRIEIDSKARSMDLIRKQMESAESDSTFQRKRQDALSYRPRDFRTL